ncbi:MAG: N-acetylmuramoyl-L-alanine amidase [Prevotella sp.]|nr:N-acetylmuramoyl-L-alanine amidase [Prevotella sp.]
MYRKFLFLLWLSLIFAAAADAAKDRFTLVIDAGHGGNDAGAIGKISKEKNINLNVALSFGRYVEANCPDVRVIYTRKTDVFIPLHERANIANRNKADLFISIHTNALPKGRIARGLETYTLGMNRAADNFDVAKRENSVILIEKDYKQRYEGFDPRSSESYIMFEFMQDRNMEQSVVLAKAVQQRTCAAAGRPNKGVKQAGFLVLRETSMPSCLIELGFITTPDEERYLNTKSGIDALGKGIYQAFLDYKKKYDKSSAVQIKASPAPAAKPEKSRRTSTTAPTTSVKTKTPAEQVQKTENKRDKRNSKSIIRELTDARNGVSTEKPEEKVVAKPDAPEKADKDVAVAPEVVAVAENKAAPIPEKPVTRSTEIPAATPEPIAQPAETAAAVSETIDSAPVFKVQILASSSNLPANDRQLKGRTDTSCYQENGLYKYTVGSSTDYNEIFRLRKSLLENFPEAFIVAFKDGQRTNVVEAIREFKTNRTKRQTL